MSSPTQRTLAYLRKHGALADVSEKWIPRANKRKDLFGFVDVVGVAAGKTLGVQATSASNVAARRAKLTAGDLGERVMRLIACGWDVQVWGWAKRMVPKKSGQGVKPVWEIVRWKAVIQDEILQWERLCQGDPL